MDNQENMFSDQLKERKRSKEVLKEPKFWMIVIIIIVAVFLLIKLYQVSRETMSVEELEKSIKIVWHDSQWVDKEITPYEVKIIPSVTIKIKNIGKKSLESVKFVGVFIFEENGDQLGDGITLALKKPLKPNEISEEIFIKSLYGYSATSKKAFIENKQAWKKIKVKIFARISSGFASLGVFKVKQEIAGIKKSYKADEEDKEITDQLARSIQIISQNSEWIDKKITAGKVIIVPSIIIKIKNVGSHPLHYVYFKGRFEFEKTGELLSEGITAALKNPLSPGKISDDILIKSEFGYSASSKTSFIENITDWQRVKVRIFAKTKQSKYALLGIYSIKQKLQGIRVTHGVDTKNI